MTARTTGPQGVYGNPKPDSGTLPATRTDPPGVKLSYSWNKNAKEGVTKSIVIRRSDAYDMSSGLTVGKVYFAVDIDKLDLDDMRGLGPLVNSLKERLGEGFEIKLSCTGAADYRWKTKYNLALGMRRAKNTAQFIKRSVLGSATASNPAFTIKTPQTLGESKATQPTDKGRRPSEWTMGKDRVVEIEIEKGGLVPPVTLAFEGPIAYSKSIEAMEVNAGGLVFASYVVTRKDEADAPREERDDQRAHSAGKRNLQHDPLQAVVEIRVKYVGKLVGGKEGRGELFCDVVHLPTGRVLFSVSKLATEGSIRTFDYKSIYEQLKGTHSNMTERINVQLGRKATKQARQSHWKNAGK